LNEVIAQDEAAAETAVFQKFKKLTLDLQATGNEFSILSESINRERTNLPAPKPIGIRSVVERAWQEVKEHFLLDKLQLREIGDDFTLAIEENDLRAAVLRVLQWLAQREDKVSAEAPTIDVEYRRRNKRLEISFTDQSRRLGGELRKRLFEPFTQIATMTPPKDGNERPGLYLPLYLTKSLVEKNKGELEDRTEELAKTAKFGHCFTMSFPVQENDVNS
jgi:K+-sensing histidine kinase KdpD